MKKNNRLSVFFLVGMSLGVFFGGESRAQTEPTCVPQSSAINNLECTCFMGADQNPYGAVWTLLNAEHDTPKTACRACNDQIQGILCYPTKSLNASPDM